MSYTPVIVVLAAGAALALQGCGGDSPSPSPSPSTTPAPAPAACTPMTATDPCFQACNSNCNETFCNSLGSIGCSVNGTSSTCSLMGTGNESHCMSSSKTIVQTAQATADLSTLVTAVVAADLVDTLSTQVLTVFAPTNEAFAALNASLNGTLQKILDDKTALTQVLTYHVVSGEVPSVALKNESVKTLEGESVNITITADGAVKVNTATVTTPNVFCTNGVVHIIDAVLVPPNFVPPTSTGAARIHV